ncbi:hypothetical protein [Streptomyces iconiensis]|uniref:TPM domain-containing protein n=1 Tax=Streptomyces iconiensis TaxID=1384038 RepID=A0ABT7A5M1_9ACTN|nr:hypothetical protein [Streptomyces iconiensis]MDJ1135928.1 hypothetical protein [Streptomyces iconiensis]
MRSQRSAPRTGPGRRPAQVFVTPRRHIRQHTRRPQAAPPAAVRAHVAGAATPRTAVERFLAARALTVRTSAVLLLTALAALASVLASAPPATAGDAGGGVRDARGSVTSAKSAEGRADGGSEGRTDGKAQGKAAGKAEDGRTDTPAAYLAERLRENPVYLSDQFPRTNPLSSAPRFAEQARRTGVPTYVLIVPREAVDVADGEELLAAVHDRLGKKGLYILLDGTGAAPFVSTFGVDVPAEDAATATQFELPYDAGTLLTLTHFVEALRSDDVAERAREALDSGIDGSEPDDLYTDPSEREDQSTATGFLLTCVPLLLLGTGLYVGRRRGGMGPGPALVGSVAAGAAVLIGVGALFVHDDTRSDGDPLPTAADMNARTERVADGLRESPLYTDPLTSGALTPRQRAALTARAERLAVPVYTAVVPLAPEDESSGHGDRLAQRLHKRLGKDGVYVVAGTRPSEGMEIVNYGGKADSSDLYRSTDKLRLGSAGGDTGGSGEGGEGEGAGEGGDSGLYERLDEVLDHVEDARASRPGEPFLPPLSVEDPVEEDALPPLYSGQMIGGAVLGAFGAAAGTGLVAAGFGIGRRTGLVGAPVSRVREVVRLAGADPLSATPDVPQRPSSSWLRRTARRELDELNEEFTHTAETVSDQVRGRAWECLDAATLLLDQEGDSRVDADADAPTLAAGLALIRAGSAALRDRTWAFPVEMRLCVLNPLHGQAVSNRKLKFPGEDGRPRARPVCAGCAAALSAPEVTRAKAQRGVIGTRLLRLRVPGGGSGAYEPYDRLPGPLAATDGTGARAGLTSDQLVRRVREQLGVH